MSLTLYLGPMCSGKTSQLLKLYNEKENCIMINSALDSRTLKTGKWTHDGKTFTGSVIYTNNILQQDIISRLNNYQNILINEAQFIQDLEVSVRHLVDLMEKNVIIGALDGDYNRIPFANISNIIPFADKIYKLNARCEYCGKPAPFTFKRGGCKKKVEIGGKNLYIPLCRAHYNDMIKNESQIHDAICQFG
jgi:thymidine kinase